MDFWKRFYQLCIEKGTKPNPLAKEIGIGSATLTKWKSGDTLPNSDTLIKIAKYFDCSIDYLLCLSESKKSSKSEFLPDELIFLEKLHSLPKDSQDEIVHMVNYKYEQLQKKRKESLSLSGSTTTDDTQDMLA